MGVRRILERGAFFGLSEVPSFFFKISSYGGGGGGGVK